MSLDKKFVSSKRRKNASSYGVNVTPVLVPTEDRMRKVLLILGLIACFAGRASATTADTWRENCRSLLDEKSNVDAALCAAYSAGFVDGLNGTHMSTGHAVYRVNFAKDMSVRQVIKVVIAYIDKHPEILHKPISDVFMSAIIEAELLVYTPLDNQPGARVRQ